MYDTLEESMAAWRKAEARCRQDGNQGTAAVCAAAATALERERETGMAVCSCCGQPFRPHRAP